MKNDIRLGIILMLSATLFFAIMDGVSRYLAETYNVMLINMLRAWVLAIIVILISMRKGQGIKKV
jgi:drug/metabolite transporter (DMT)-like permease